jgi:amino acid adenylation domain-containing protein
MKTFQHEFFERTADRVPSAAAIEDGDASITYGDLEVRANRIAHLLRHLGCRPNDRVCIATAKNIEAYAAVLGTLKSGVCWVPLSLSYPEDRLTWLIRTLAPKAIIADTSTLDAVFAARNRAASQAAIIAIGSVSKEDPATMLLNEHSIRAASPDRPKRNDLSPADLAYIIFTSGSTGTPKGVMVQHYATSLFLSYCRELFPVESSLRFANLSELNFDPSIFDLFYCWSTGGTVLPFNRRSYRINPALFLRERRPDVLFSVPSMLSQILASGDEVSGASVKHLLMTGEVLPPALVERWYKLYGSSVIYNVYGTTETAIISHSYRVPRQLEGVQNIPVGRPLPGTRIYLMDDGNLRADVTEGECVVYSGHLSCGYWANEFQTSQVFIPDPRNPSLPQILYRTGDRLRRTNDGVYEFLGRVDRQVKVRGHRVELNEVESVLLQHDRVQDVVVLVTESSASHEARLVAFVVSGDEVTEEELRRHAMRLLPSYMVPSNILFMLGDLPRNTNGKIDLVALRNVAAEPEMRDANVRTGT